jgi:outer membrane protein TolC
LRDWVESNPETLALYQGQYEVGRIDPARVLEIQARLVDSRVSFTRVREEWLT